MTQLCIKAVSTHYLVLQSRLLLALKKLKKD